MCQCATIQCSCAFEVKLESNNRCKSDFGHVCGYVGMCGIWNYIANQHWRTQPSFVCFCFLFFVFCLFVVVVFFWGGGHFGEGTQARVPPKLKTPRIYATVFRDEPKFTSEKISDLPPARGPPNHRLYDRICYF